MSRLGSLGSLGTDQLRALRRLSQIGQAISENQVRLTTLKRINSAKDDPAGLVQATKLEQEIAAAEAASRSVTRASAMLNTADAAAGEIVVQLQEARTLALEAAGGGLSSSEVAANQVEIDTILRSINNLAQTSFGGKALLTGGSGFSVNGVDSDAVSDIDVLDKSVANDVTVTVNVTTTAAQAADTYTGGALADDVTLIVQGTDGTTTISLDSGASLQAVADAFNAVTHETGITAAVDGGNVEFTSTDYGSAATISIEAIEGTFELATGGTVEGTDAVATINGNQYTGDGSTFSVHNGQVSLRIELDPTASGAITPFTVTGTGVSVNVGSNPSSIARVGLPNLLTSSLGGVDGRLSSIASGAGNSLVEGNAAAAVRILDDAISDATRSRGIIGGFQKFTLDSSSRVLESQIEHLSEGLSAIQDTDVAIEAAKLTNNQLLQESAFQALSISAMRNQSVLNLLKGLF